ncbi:hypothetical protein [Caproiciproducens faecalis]|uniref:Uncharacterized protein n=1 Tax=Caproiciproducens faecalis TaxID=2820301 RepID=A0ABS7DJQ3_9FIRM|nr:hypothetical protein [Caproiciproducens faecalis]MBW7571334.1 hypothetical protein [Caproiciproducens faecalis]
MGKLSDTSPKQNEFSLCFFLPDCAVGFSPQWQNKRAPLRVLFYFGEPSGIRVLARYSRGRTAPFCASGAGCPHQDGENFLISPPKQNEFSLCFSPYLAPRDSHPNGKIKSTPAGALLFW